MTCFAWCYPMLCVLGTFQGISAYWTLTKPQLNKFFRSEVQVVRNLLKFNEILQWKMNLVQKILLGYTFAQSALLYALLFVIINIYSVYSILVFGFQMILKRQVLRLILTLKISLNIEFNLTLTVKFQLFLSLLAYFGNIKQKNKFVR